MDFQVSAARGSSPARLYTKAPFPTSIRRYPEARSQAEASPTPRAVTGAFKEAEASRRRNVKGLVTFTSGHGADEQPPGAPDAAYKM